MTRPIRSYALTLQQVNTTVPVISFIEDHLYPELAQFKQDIQREAGALLHAYHYYKKFALIYRCVFAGFTGLFTALMAMVLLMSDSSWPFLAILGHNLFVKATLGTLSAVLAVLALMMTLSISPAREAVNHSCRRAHRWVRQMYRLRLAKLGWRRFLLNDPEVTQQVHAYHDILEKMHDAREKTLVLLNHISAAKHLKSEDRVNLFNQAVLELRDQLHFIISSYRK